MNIDPSVLSVAERVLWKFGVTQPEHIDLEAIADQYNVVVRLRKLSGADARIVGVGDRAVISVSTATSPQRQRFSIGHELGHWLLEKRDDGLLACSKVDVTPRNQLARTAEAEANRFSSDLLLPPYLVRPRARTLPCNVDSALQVARDFRASVTASAISLVRLSTVPALVAVYATEGRKWFMNNVAWPADVFPVSQIHHETRAMDLLFQGEPGAKTVDVADRGDRWITCRDAYRMTVRAQAIRLPNGLLLTLVRLAK